MSEFTPWIALGSAAVSFMSMLIALGNRRDSTSKDQLHLQLAPLLKDIEHAKLEATLARAKAIEHTNEMMRLEIRLLEHLKAYPTSEHLESLLRAQLEGITNHTMRVEKFMEEVLRTGVLNSRGSK